MKTKPGPSAATHFEQVPVRVAKAAASNLTAFPVECPSCALLGGFPYRARTDMRRAGRVHVDMRCHHCKHEWEIDRPSPSLAVITGDRS